MCHKFKRSTHKWTSRRQISARSRRLNQRLNSNFNHENLQYLPDKNHRYKIANMSNMVFAFFFYGCPWVFHFHYGDWSHFIWNTRKELISISTKVRPLCHNCLISPSTSIALILLEIILWNRHFSRTTTDKWFSLQLQFLRYNATTFSCFVAKKKNALWKIVAAKYITAIYCARVFTSLEIRFALYRKMVWFQMCSSPHHHHHIGVYTDKIAEKQQLDGFIKQ